MPAKKTLTRPKNLADWKWRIARAGLTQSDVADEAGISKATLCLAIQGKRKPHDLTIAKIEKILKACGV